MHDQSYVKLFRRVLNNPIWKDDHSAVHLFLTLLLLVDYTKGQVATSRRALATTSGMAKSTIHEVLKRLVAYKMITIAPDTNPDSKKCIISICKWKYYQAPAGQLSGHNVRKNINNNIYNNFLHSVQDEKESNYSLTEEDEPKILSSEARERGLAFLADLKARKPMKGVS